MFKYIRGLHGPLAPGNGKIVEPLDTGPYIDRQFLINQETSRKVIGSRYASEERDELRSLLGESDNILHTSVFYAIIYLLGDLELLDVLGEDSPIYPPLYDPMIETDHMTRAYQFFRDQYPYVIKEKIAYCRIKRILTAKLLEVPLYMGDEFWVVSHFAKWRLERCK